MSQSKGKSTFGKHFDVLPVNINCTGRKSLDNVAPNTAVICHLSSIAAISTHFAPRLSIVQLDDGASLRAVWSQLMISGSGISSKHTTDLMSIKYCTLIRSKASGRILAFGSLFRKTHSPQNLFAQLLFGFNEPLNSSIICLLCLSSIPWATATTIAEPIGVPLQRISFIVSWRYLSSFLPSNGGCPRVLPGRLTTQTSSPIPTLLDFSFNSFSYIFFQSLILLSLRSISLKCLTAFARWHTFQSWLYLRRKSSCRFLVSLYCSKLPSPADSSS